MTDRTTIAWMRRLVAMLLALVVVFPAAAADPASCRTVRLSDVGWADVTATTGLTGRILTGLGYSPKITVLSVPVTFNGLRNKDVDVFLGNWMPMQTADIKPYAADHSVEVVRVNLPDARYTLAVPAYLYDQGLRDFASIQKFAGPLGHRIYGIEPGNDGNRLVLGMIRNNSFGLGDFQLIESSEQGMLAEVERSVRTKAPIVFLGWQPHPMNDRFKMRYLMGGDSVFGPNYGSATVATDVRTGYLQQCPNVGRLLHNLAFGVEDENALMQAVTDTGDPAIAATKWLRVHPDRLHGWLDGVQTADGKPGEAAVLASLKPAAGSGFLTENKIPVGPWMSSLVDSIKAHHDVFDFVTLVLGSSINGLTWLLSAIPPLLFVALVGGLAWYPAAIDPAGDLRAPRAAVHHQPGLLGGDDGDAVARAVRRLRLDADRRARRHLGGASPARLPVHPARARSDADAADLRLPDPDAGAVRAGRGARPHLDDHLRAPRADPADAARHPLGAAPADRGGAEFRRDAVAIAHQGRAARRRTLDRRGRHAVHHAQPVDGGDRRPGRRGRARRPRRARAQHGAGRHGIRGGLRDRAGRDHPRSHDAQHQQGQAA